MPSVVATNGRQLDANMIDFEFRSTSAPHRARQSKRFAWPQGERCPGSDDWWRISKRTEPISASLDPRERHIRKADFNIHSSSGEDVFRDKLRSLSHTSDGRSIATI